MNYFATGYAQKSVDEDGFAERRRMADMVQQIQQQRAIVVASLTQWMRHRDHVLKNGDSMTPKEKKSSEQIAQQAMTRLIEARQQENAVFKALLDIDDTRLAIGHGGKS